MSLTNNYPSIDNCPSIDTLLEAKILQARVNKPVKLDYWCAPVKLGVYSNKDKILFENEENYTSKIQNIILSGDEYLVETEYSIFIVPAGIQSYRIK